MMNSEKTKGNITLLRIYMEEIVTNNKKHKCIMRRRINLTRKMSITMTKMKEFTRNPVLMVIQIINPTMTLLMKKDTENEMKLGKGAIMTEEKTSPGRITASIKNGTTTTSPPTENTENDMITTGKIATDAVTTMNIAVTDVVVTKNRKAEGVKSRLSTLKR